MAHVNIPHFSRFTRSVKSLIVAACAAVPMTRSRRRSSRNRSARRIRPTSCTLSADCQPSSDRTARLRRRHERCAILADHVAAPTAAQLCPPPLAARASHRPTGCDSSTPCSATPPRAACSFLPVPATTRTGESFVAHAGHLWELAPWMPGTADYERSPSAEKLRAAMTALATIPRRRRRFSPVAAAARARAAGRPNAIARHLARLRELDSRRNQRACRAQSPTQPGPTSPHSPANSSPHCPSAIPRAIAQLEPLANIHLPLQPCLRDIWHDHVLFTGNEVTGLIDFGAIDIDTPATDIARLLGSFASYLPSLLGSGQGEGSCVRHLANHRPGRRPRRLHRNPPTLTRRIARRHTPSTPAAPSSPAAIGFAGSIIEGRQFENRQQVLQRFRRISSRTENR